MVWAGRSTSRRAAGRSVGCSHSARRRLPPRRRRSSCSRRSRARPSHRGRRHRRAQPGDHQSAVQPPRRSARSQPQTDELVLAVHALSNPRCDSGTLCRAGRLLARNVKGKLLSINTDHTMLAAVLAHPSADSRLLDEVAGSGAYHHDLRLAVASNPQAGPRLLQRLSKDPCPSGARRCR